MKVRKILALVLALLLVFAIGAFAQEEGEPGGGEPGAGEPGAGGGKQEAAATQAFERSWSTKGWFQWRYAYTETNTGAATKDVSSAAYNLLYLNFTYNISESLSLNVALFWGAYWGAGRGQGGYVPPLASGNNLARSHWGYNPLWMSTINNDAVGINYGGTVENSVGKSYVTPNANYEWLNYIYVKSIYMTWKIGGALGKLSIGRMPATWAHDGAFFGLFSGADRINWQGSMKLAGYMFLPGFIYELRQDLTTARNDELHQLIPTIIMIGPGKMIEQIWFAFSAFVPSSKTQTQGEFYYHAGAGAYSEYYTDMGLAGLGNTWKFYIANLFMKMRMGGLMEINFEVNAVFGADNMVGDEYNKKFSIGFILDAKINLGMISLRPEIAVITAKDRDALEGGGATSYSFVGNMHGSSDIGPALMGATYYGQNGEGLFYFTLLAEVKLGALTIWLEPGFGMQLGKTMVNGAENTGDDTHGRFLGFEIDLGINVKLTEGLTFGLEIDYWMPGGQVGKDGVVGTESMFAIMTTFDMTF